MDTANELEVAVTAFSDGRKADMEDAIQRLFLKEVEIDNLRRATLEELSSTELPNVYREDLKRLVNHLDEFADQIKDSARSLKVLAFAAEIPRDILDGYLKMSHNLVETVNALGDCIEVLGTIPAEVRAKAERVDHFEDLIDQQYLETKMLFMKHGGELDAATLLSLRDLLDYIERASDTCARTADYLRTLATQEVQ